MDGERKKIHNKTDPKKRRKMLHEKLTKRTHKVFQDGGVELPSGKMFHPRRVVGMSDLKNKGAEKSDAKTTSNHKLSGKNSKITQEHCFSACLPPAMHVSSGARVSQD